MYWFLLLFLFYKPSTKQDLTWTEMLPLFNFNGETQTFRSVSYLHVQAVSKISRWLTVERNISLSVCYSKGCEKEFLFNILCFNILQWVCYIITLNNSVSLWENEASLIFSQVSFSRYYYVYFNYNHYSKMRMFLLCS
jgi:hypothetical protein